MVTGICLYGFTALRANPQSSAEMISSLVFGDTYLVLEEKKDWLRVKNIFDSYEGWLSQSNHNILNDGCLFEVTKLNEQVETSDGRIINIGAGCSVPVSQDFMAAGVRYSRIKSTSSKFTTLGSVAKSYLGTPYLWGGRSLYGIDCSGFVQMVYKCFGVNLPRDSKPQSLYNSNKLDFNSLNEGDLVFFTQRTEQISHVGIYLGQGRIIHASADVHIDTLTAEGIFKNSNNLTHHFAWGLRID